MNSDYESDLCPNLVLYLQLKNLNPRQEMLFLLQNTLKILLLFYFHYHFIDIQFYSYMEINTLYQKLSQTFSLNSLGRKTVRNKDKL